MPIQSNSSSRSSRIVGPTFTASTPLTDDTYDVYGLNYCDYLQRIIAQDIDRPYVTPPLFPQGKSITALSQQYHRRLYAMYMDVATKQQPSSSIPGYCYMSSFPSDKSREIAAKLGPYPTIGDVAMAVRLLKINSSVNLVRQIDGTLHVVHSSTSDSIAVDLLQLSESSIDSRVRVGGRFMSIDRPVLAVRSRGLPLHAVELTVGANLVHNEHCTINSHGKWEHEVLLRKDHMLLLPLGCSAQFFDIALFSDDQPAAIYALEDSYFRLQTSSVVDPRELSPDGSFVWSTHWKEQYASTSRPVECNVFKPPPMIPYKPYSADWWFTEKDNYFFFDPKYVDDDEDVSHSHDSVSITDPLDDYAPHQEFRHEFRLEPDVEHLMCVPAGWYPVKLYAFRSFADTIEHVICDCLRISNSDTTVVLLSNVRVKTRYKFPRDQVALSVSFREVRAAIGESYDMFYGDSD